MKTFTEQNRGNPSIFYTSKCNAFISFSAQHAYRMSPG